MARGTWGSRIGFILAAAGSAVGLGAIWKFPFVAGQNGGGAFLILYLVFSFSIGLALLLAEMLIGRAAGLSAVSAFRKLAGGAWPWAARLSVLCVFLILSFYSVVGGWTLIYLFEGMRGTVLNTDTAALGVYFHNASSDPVLALGAALGFLGLTGVVVYLGVQRGIEQMSKVLMPLLFLLMAILIVRALTLPGALAGLSWFVTPDWEQITPGAVVEALGLACFSLSVGAGTMVAYGSYVPRETDLPRAAAWVALLAVGSCLLAGLMVLPAVFAFGLDPAAGPGLTFITMPAVFAQLPAGQVFAIAFFFLLLVAALTSSVSMLEPLASYLIDEFGVPRRRAVLLCCAAVALACIPAALSGGVWREVQFLGLNLFELMDYTASNLLLPIGGVVSATCVGWAIWPRARGELSNGAQLPWWLPLFRAVCAVGAPLLIGWVFLYKL
ncbi:sodium-dependent transporter [Chitiniphilus purpureus]|uniref:Transporter n=1 Tax=Chitiniphilus purpureus TaxID=2981137 RepID=A0ABY6DI26_9NEIS|nr:sodium-dependent transporter [Chitiniphilus sp. CD1]UXY13999.1 sodium-dependent transporter [Chitiniphilus sp. CD1]